jgi:hypothetical protein
MTGIPEFNFPLFRKAAAYLRSVGYEIISPAELDSPEIQAAAAVSKDGTFDGTGKIAGETWGDMLSRDVKVVADYCGGIMLLPGWERSRGARLEAFVGLLCKHHFYLVTPAVGALFNVRPIHANEVRGTIFGEAI